MVVGCKRETCESRACGQDARGTGNVTRAGGSRVHGVLEGENHVTDFLFRSSGVIRVIK